LVKAPDLDAIARSRVLMVLSVLSGEKPVTSAIDEAGISRGLYYQLETKALNAMLLALAPGADSEASPDATGLHQRIKDLEAKVSRAEQAQRRAERMLYVQRKMMGHGPVKTNRGPRPKKTTSSKPTGRRSWRSSTTPSATSTKPPSTTRSTKPPASAPSTPTPDGVNVVP
jgi:hypothetical protein